MASKDLNLNLEPAQVRKRRAQRPGPALESVKLPRIAPALATSALQDEEVAAGPTPGANPESRVPVAVLLLIVLLNGLFMAGTVYWLKFAPPAQPIATSDQPSDADLYTARALSALQASLLGLEKRLDHLQLSVNDQQRLATGFYLDFEAHISNPAEEAKVATTPPADELVEATPEWVVNAGSFKQHDEAVLVQGLLTNLGYQADITSRTEGEQVTYGVKLGGFGDRSAAEQATQQIMNKTTLNGLWVWKET